MTLFTVLAALALEHWRPERPRQPRQWSGAWLAWLMEHLNAGGEQHGALAWSVGVLLPALLALGLASLLSGLGWPLAWAFDVAVLYFCLGFMSASSRAAAVFSALRQGDAELARSLLSSWRPNILAGADEAALLRQTLEEVLRQSMVRLFGVLFWFLVLGAAGALAYLLTRLARDRWHAEPAFGLFAERMAGWLDWLPVRLLAFSFAIVGNFQDAQEAWRAQARTWRDEGDGILLAAAAGALGLRLGGPLNLVSGILPRPVLGLDDERGLAPGPDALDAVTALIWRAVLLWVAVLALLWLGSL